MLNVCLTGTHKWNAVSPMCHHRTQCGAAVVNSKIYAVGGRGQSGEYLGEVERYSADLNVWRPVAPLLLERCPVHSQRLPVCNSVH